MTYDPNGRLTIRWQAGSIVTTGDPEKLRMAGRLRQEATMTLAWVSERLHMGAPSLPPP